MTILALEANSLDLTSLVQDILEALFSVFPQVGMAKKGLYLLSLYLISPWQTDPVSDAKAEY
jgi:hypothetical protein